MSDIFDLQGSVKLDSKEVLDGLAKVDKQVDETGKSMENVEGKSGKFGKALGGLGKTMAGAFSLSIIKDFTQGCINEANEAIMAETKLRNNLMATGKATEDNVQQLMEYGASMQKVGVIEADVNNVGMAQLATFGLSSDAIKTLDKGMLDLAVNQKGVSASGEDLMGYANLLGKAMQGNAGALTKVGVTMDEHQKKIIETGTEQEKAAVIAEVLQQNYGNLNEEIAKTPEGKTAQLKNDLGDLKETLGTALLPIIVQVVGWIQQLVNWFTSLSPVMQKTLLVGGLILAFIPGLIGMLSGLATVAGACGISFTAMALPILAIIAVIGAVIAIGVLLYQNWDTIKEKAGQLGAWLGEKWNGIKEKTAETWNNMKETTSQTWGAMKNKIEEHGGGIKGIIGTTMEGAKKGWELGFNAMDNATGGKLSAMKDKVSNGLNAIKDFFSNLRLSEIKIPHIKMPHLNISGAFSISPPSAPSFGVDWYSSGGIFTKKTVLPGGIGVGDKNKGQGSSPEAILPISDLEDMIKKLLQVTIPLDIDGREFTRKVVAPHQEELDKYNSRNPQLAY